MAIRSRKLARYGHTLQNVRTVSRIPQTSTAVEPYTDPSTWSEERLDEWAASPPVVEREAWLKRHNGPF